MAVTGFEHAHRDVQMEDLYYFLRKCMEKHHYDERLGYRMMRAYDSVNNLGKKNGLPCNPSCLSGKILEDHQFVLPLQERHGFLQKCRKLSLSVAQTEEKAVFAESVCVSDIAFGFLRF